MRVFPWGRVALISGTSLILVTLAIVVAITWSSSAPVRAIEPRILDRTDLPPLQNFNARDGTSLAYRSYPANHDDQVVIAMHGSATESSVMNALAKTLQKSGVVVYAPDLRGHGASGRRGDIDYIGQLDDDLADFAMLIRKQHPRAELTLLGFSLSGALAIRVAGGPYDSLFDRYIVLAPALPSPAPVARPNSGWAALNVPRTVGLYVLNKIGIHWFDNLQTIIFATPKGKANLTSAYSFRLMMNAGDIDYLGALRNSHKPMALLVGAQDDQFFAERYRPLLKPAKPDLDVEIVPGLGHVDMITNPSALDAIRRTFERQPTRIASQSQFTQSRGEHP